MNTFLCFLILACFTYHAQAIACPCKWEEFNGRCYYVSENVAPTWLSARSSCRLQGGDLVVPTSSEIDNFVFKAMKAHNVQDVFIGLYRVSEGLGDKKFYTVRGTEPSYINWRVGEPNNYKGAQEDCVNIRIFDGKWNDFPCTGYHRHFICEGSFQR